MNPIKGSTLDIIPDLCELFLTISERLIEVASRSKETDTRKELLKLSKILTQEAKKWQKN